MKKFLPEHKKTTVVFIVLIWLFFLGFYQTTKNLPEMKLIFLVLVWLFFLGFYQTTKNLPKKLNYRGEERNIDVRKIKFLYDLTYQNIDGKIISKQMIFDEILSLIERAEAYILIDAFLFNSYKTEQDRIFRRLSSEMTERLAKKRESNPNIRIDFITDPINTVYGGAINLEIEKLKKTGVNVIVTDLKALPDSNPLYSAFWRTFIQWFGNSVNFGLIPHPFTGNKPKVTLRSYLDMLNFKANHRKIFMADQGKEIAVVLTSANPHDGSSAHSNVALKITGSLWQDVYNAETAIANFSRHSLQGPPMKLNEDPQPEGPGAKIVFLTENKIKKELISSINKTTVADEISMALFYLADREVIKALVGASERGVYIRAIFDPNKAAFGFKKIGIPNQPVAEELFKASSGKIEIRWYDTHAEQFHTKMVIIKHNHETSLILGSANFTRRNLNNYNLEANISVIAKENDVFMKEAEDYYKRIWNNRDGNHYTTRYESYKDASKMKKIIYLFQEYSGLCSF